uniref:Tudor domain-containing protein n=1 Tax=Plectus sambesii TaxID=2011161 RepID=A0A914XHD3_9BILA
MTLLRRAGGVAFYADIQRMYLDEYRRNLDQLELRRLFGATGSAFRTLESQFRNEIHVTEPSQGRLHLRLRNFTAPVFGGGSPMRGGGTMLRGGRGGSFGGHQAISRAQPPAAFSKYLPTRPTAFGDDLPSMWDGQSAGAAPSQFTRAFNSSYNASSLTVVVGGNGANRQVSSASNSGNPLPHSEIVTPSTQSFVAPRLPSIHTNSTTQPSPTSTDRQNWPTSASSSSMSAMAQISNRTPTILKLLEHLVAMLAKRHPRGISLAELGDAYEQDYGMRLDTLAIYRKSWNELITGQFRDRLILDNDNIVHLSSKESLRQGLPAASSSAAAAQPGQPQRSLATNRSPSGPTSTTAAPPTRPAPTSSAPSSANANAINNNGGSAGSADLSENIRRLFEAASKETEGLPIVRVAAMLGCAEADALRTAVIQFPTYFQIKFVEGTCYVTAKRDTVLPPATAPSNLSVPSASLPSSRPSVDPIPIDFILPTQSVGFDPSQPLSSDEEADARMIWVQVSDYQSPMRFSLVLRDNVPAVTELQRQLAEFYSKLSFDECRLPAEELVLGRVCAVEYQGNGDFHRARIVDVDENRTLARVVYVDYGSQQNVPAQFICQLDRRFADLPAQALLASFLPIRPPNGQEDFSEELGVRMGEMCNDDGQDIWAIIMEYNAAEEKMIVELCSKRMDENGEEQDMWVMEALRSEGLLEVVDREQP